LTDFDKKKTPSGAELWALSCEPRSSPKLFF